MEFFAEDVGEGDEGPEIDGNLHGDGVEEAQVAVVLAEEDEHGLIEDVDIAVVGLLGGLALIVGDGERQVPVLPAALEQTVGEVDVLAVHKEVLIEQSHLIEGLATQHIEGAADDVDASGLVPRQMTHIVSFGEAEHLQSSHPRCGQSATRLGRKGLKLKFLILVLAKGLLFKYKI